ncbi:MAG: class I SAM-dependent DNA methyltransferase [Planctomycetota bacterium]
MPSNHRDIANFIWSICNLLRGPYKRNEYRKVILPLTVLRRFDCLLEPTKDRVLAEHAKVKAKPESVIELKLRSITGRSFYNLSRLTMAKLLDDPNQLAPNLNSYINAFSKNVRDIMDRFAFDQQIAKLAEKNLLYEVVKAFVDPKLDLSDKKVDNTQMGYVFEELIRIGAEQSNEEAGEHFTPREVIKLMVNLLLSPEQDLRKSHVVKTIYDPACGTGGMLSVSERYIRDLNSEASPKLFGQDWNDEAWAVCKSDMLIKGDNADNIVLGDTFTSDGFQRNAEGKKWTFDYMLANPPFGVEWKQQKRYIDKEQADLGYEGRFGAGLPRVNDGALLFLQHMLDKMQAPKAGGSRIAIVFNGSPLFTGDAGSGESNIRQWIIEQDWLEAIVALPEQLFYNTGISTYLWVLSNRKEKQRKGKIQLIDARNFWVPMKKSLGNKRRKIGDPTDEQSPHDPDHIGEIARIYGNFSDGESREFSHDVLNPTRKRGANGKNGQSKTMIVSKIFDNADFGYRKITVERPLKLNFQADDQRLARLEDESAFKGLATSKKKNEQQRIAEIAAGQARQQTLREFLKTVQQETGGQLFRDRKAFLKVLKSLDKRDSIKLSSPELKAILSALCERDETAAICKNAKGEPESDSELRDTESVPLKENVEAYFAREVLPHVPEAWIDESKEKIGYEIPLNRHFYRYEPPRELEDIETDIKLLETEIMQLLKEVTA